MLLQIPTSSVALKATGPRLYSRLFAENVTFVILELLLIATEPHSTKQICDLDLFLSDDRTQSTMC